MPKRRNTCITCQDPARPGGRECDACSVYRRRNSAPRPPHLIERARARASRPPIDRTATVYIFRDSLGAVLYVGMTARGTLRLAQHSTRCQWWSEAATVELSHCTSVPEALALEESLVRSLCPRYNVSPTGH